MNIQHIESLNEEVKKITGIEVTERVPDKILALADEVVNIDLTADELLTRLKEGKIYKKEKVQTALSNFFQSGHILQLRELALKEVATHVERKVETEIKTENFKPIKFLACISSNEKIAKTIIRKTARLASYYSSQWTVLYIQKPSENPEKIALDKQRYLINNFNLAQELGAKVVRIKESSVHKGILDYVIAHNITTVCIGKPHAKFWHRLLGYSWIYTLMNRLNERQVDIIILS